jgi:hypothetical protein
VQLVVTIKKGHRLAQDKLENGYACESLWPKLFLEEKGKDDRRKESNFE